MSKTKIRLRTFYCEFKYRPEEEGHGDIEELIEALDLQIPRLQDSKLEIQWAIALAWNLLESEETQAKGINQVFLFTENGRELIARLQSNPFDDEPSRKLSPPDENAYESWRSKLEKRFLQIYQIPLSVWESKEKNNAKSA